MAIIAERAASVGRELTSGLYYEILGSPASGRPPLLFIHGGGCSGDHFRATPDGRKGWADLLADQGWRTWVTDWPGTGRSGYRDLLTLDYADVVDGYRRLLRDVIGEPVIVIPHSMGGPITWKLIELEPELVAAVVGVAPGYPGNLASRASRVIEDDGSIVRFTFGDTGVEFVLDRTRPYVYEDAYVYQQAIGASRQFPVEHVDRLRAGFTGISPRMILQRTGIIPGMPVIDDPRGFVGKRIWIVAGDQDPAHTLEFEQRTTALLQSWGARAEVVWLADRGISGNGHMLALERNSDNILAVISSLLEEVA